MRRSFQTASFLLIAVFLCSSAAVTRLLNATSNKGVAAGDFILNNGVMRVVLNGLAPPGQRYPCITELSVEGAVIVPPIAVGALFQMDVRSSQGNNYNPTQSGACAGDASKLAAYEENWAFLPSASTQGILMGVVPRTFESSTGQCTQGISTPFYFNWGVQLGNDVVFPKEAMLVEQTFQRTSASAPCVDSVGVEIPTVYYGCDFALYAYYLPTDSPSSWAPMNHPSTGSNYLPNWPVGTGFMLNGYGNMRCNGDISQNPNAMCAATYTAYHQSTVGGTNNGVGGCPANIVPQLSYEVCDRQVYSRLAIFAVGNVGTVSAAMIQTAANLTQSDWGNLN
jgi:hypothetical protein